MSDDTEKRSDKSGPRRRRGVAKTAKSSGGGKAPRSRASTAILRPEKPQRRKVSAHAGRRGQPAEAAVASATEASENKDAEEVRSNQGKLPNQSQADGAAASAEQTEVVAGPTDQPEDTETPAPEERRAPTPVARKPRRQAKARGTSEDTSDNPQSEPRWESAKEEPTPAKDEAEADEERAPRHTSARQSVGRSAPAKLGEDNESDESKLPPTVTAGDRPSDEAEESTVRPPLDPISELLSLAERDFKESAKSLRSVAESRTMPELLDRQSKHMQLMAEIWMRQTGRTTELFFSILRRRR